MASAELVQQLEEQLETINRYQDTELVSRLDDWGPITFEIAAQDIETAKSIAADLSSMPLMHLTDQAINDIMAHIPNVSSYLQRIDKFKLESDPAGNRNNIASHLKSAVEQLHTAASQWIPYLAYKHGDFSENIRQFTSAIASAQNQLDESASYVATKRDEVARIVALAREAAGRAGVATFTQEFDAESKVLAATSRWWLGAVVGLALLTITAALVSFFWPPLSDNASGWVTLRHVVAKVSVIAILFTGTVWCGRIYRALTHQRSVNRHRALSLTTFQAFVEATDDPGTRDAVLMAATKSIFGTVPTGFVDERGATQDTSVNVLEIGKSAGKAVPTRKANPPEE